MSWEIEQYFETLTVLVKKEIDLYTKYAVRLREDGGIRHIYDTKIFKEELQNILEDEFSSMDRVAYGADRKRLRKEWELFHEKAYQKMQRGTILPFEYMLRKLHLTEFERYCVCLAMAPELNREFERLYCYLQDDYHFKYPALDLCMKMFTLDSLSQKMLIHQTVNRKEVLQSVFQMKSGAMESELSWKLKLRDDLIAFVFYYESDLRNRKSEYYLQIPQVDEGVAVEINPQIRRRLEQYLKSDTADRMQIFILKGTNGSGRKRQVRLAAEKQRKTALFFDLREVQKKSVEQRLEMIQDAVVRAVLDQALLCFDHWEALHTSDAWDTGMIQELFRCASVWFSTVFLITEETYLPERGILERYRVELFEMKQPTVRQRKELWKCFFGGDTAKYEGICESLSAQFDFAPGTIEEIVETAKRDAKTDEAGMIDIAQIYEACQQKISHRLGDRADRVNAAYTWEELVLEEEQKGLLRQACNQMIYRYQVYDAWGFQRKMPYGRGVSMLFFGPPGTGKTMAAQVLANELHLELYKVDLSGVLSKYIGETQKNLKEIFDEVQKSRSILFFDEADVLFSKRVNVTDARDISANAQTAYLLQKMEEYDGITILATNLMQNFDDAYKRRIKYMISFPLPGKEQREMLWKKVFPKEMPLKEDLDLEYLASNFELSGASIKNIALNAAFLAAAQKEVLGMEQIVVALQQEYQKAGKTLGREELKEYYSYD